MTSLAAPALFDVPGLPASARWPCVDCGVDVIKLGEWYMVRDRVWTQAGMGIFDGFLCIGCLVERLGRPLTGRDFPAYPVNHPSCRGTMRLTALRWAAWRVWTPRQRRKVIGGPA